MARKISEFKSEERLERLDRLIEQLKECDNLELIAQLGQSAHDWLFENYQDSSAGTYISRDYIPAIMTAFPASPGDNLKAHESWQKVNGKWLKRHRVIETLMPTTSEWNNRNNPTKQLREEKANDKLPLFPPPLITTAKELLLKDTWNKIAAGLILLTGRRPTEISWCGNFEMASPYTLIFNGQLKKGTIEHHPFEIPTLIEAELILKAFTKMREQLKSSSKIPAQTTAHTAGQACNGQINQSIRKHFSKLLGAPQDNRGKKNRLSASNLRAAYAKIACYFYCPPQSEPIFYSAKILGHQTNNYATETLATTIHYHTYYIVDRSGAFDGARGIHHNRFKLNLTMNNELESKPKTAKDVQSDSEAIEPINTKQVQSNPEAIEPINAKELQSDSEAIELINAKEIQSDSEAIELINAKQVQSNPEAIEPKTAKELQSDSEAIELINAKEIQSDSEAIELINAKQVQSDPEAIEPKTAKDVQSNNLESKEGEPTNEPDPKAEEISAIPADAKNAEELANRLNKCQRSIYNNYDKGAEHFALWSASCDPDGIAWQYHSRDRLGDRKLPGILFVPKPNGPSYPDNAIMGIDLAKRLGCHLSTLSRNRDKGKFRLQKWSAKKDPEGIAWQYLNKGQLDGSDSLSDIYVPLSAAEKQSIEPCEPQTTQSNSSATPSPTKDDLTYQSIAPTPALIKERDKPPQVLELSPKLQEQFDRLCYQYQITGDRTEQLVQLLDLLENDKQPDLSQSKESLETTLATLSKLTQQLGLDFNFTITSKTDRS